jgi:cytochrome c-type biogenesis protein CcmH/NrfG
LRFSSQQDQAPSAYATALRLADEVAAVTPNSPENLYFQAWAAASTGDTARARELIERALRLAPGNPYASYFAGLIEAHDGNADGAIEALERAVAEGYPTVMLAADPLLTSLRSERAFDILVRDAG